MEEGGELFKVDRVIKRDGRVVPFDINRIRRAITRAMREVKQYDEKKLREVVDYVVKVINETYTKENPPHVEDIQDIIEYALVKHGLFQVAKAYILYRKERERIRKEKMAILGKDYADEVDKRLSLNAIRLLASRYLLKDQEGQLIEDPKGMFVRVASLVVIPDILHDPRVFDKEGGQPVHPTEEFNPEEWEGKVGLRGIGGPEFTWNRYHLERMKALYDELNKQGKMRVPWSRFWQMLLEGEFDDHYWHFLEYYSLMAELRFLPNSPTLFNAGTRLGQLSACFVLDMEDSLDSIMKAAVDASKIFQSGGGIGINYSKLRPEGDIVRSTNGRASGPVSFMRIIDVITDVVKQGGRRRGANMGILEVWHPDIWKFIECKSKPGQYENFNISVMITSNFWEYFEKGEPYPLVNPRNGEAWGTANPRELFRKIAEMAWKSGDPGVLFLDNINKRNVLREALGEIRSTNPCVSGDSRVLTPRGWITARELFEEARFSGPVRTVTVDEDVLGEGGEPTAYRVRLVTIQGNEVIYRTAHGDELRLLVPMEVDAWVWHVGRKPGLRVETEEGYELTVTHDHRFLTAEGWKEARSLRPGDRILIARMHPALLDGSYRGDYDLDEDVAFALGWLVGDGTFNKHYVAWFFSGEDEAAEERVRRGVEKLGGNPLSHTYVLSESEHKVQYNAGTTVYRNVMRLMGSLMEKSRERGLPEIAWRLSPRSLAAFLRGLFTADGYVDEDRAIRLTSASLRLLREVQILLTTFGIASKIYERPYGGEFHYVTKDGEERTYEASGYYELLIRGYSRKIFKELIGFESIRKLEKLCLKKTKRDPVWATVRSVEDAGIVDFYDFTVPVHHNYVANGLANHNCGEEPLYPYESCNLGSINLYAYVRFDEETGEAEFDWEAYAKDVRLALRFLDNVIDVNKYPIPEIEEHTKLTRKVGLGLMGLADTLFALGIPYHSEEGFAFMRQAAEWLTYHALMESAKLASERGPFPLYHRSSYVKGELPVEGYYHPELWTLDWEKLAREVAERGVRNAEVTTIAPTGSISMIADVSSGIEPQFALVFEKRVSVGEFFYVDREFERQLKRMGLYSERLLKEVADNGGSVQGIEELPEEMRRVFVVAYDIPWWDHVRAQAEISKWICAAVSKTINMPNWVTVDDVEKAYLLAYRLGLKGITIYRDGSKAAQVLVTPSQRKGEYVLEIPNDTLEIMKSLGIEPPSKAKAQPSHEAAIAEKGAVPVFSPPRPSTSNQFEVCPECGSKRLIYREDCVMCLDCGWSACVVT